jgi:hypothetical protein
VAGIQLVQPSSAAIGSVCASRLLDSVYQDVEVDPATGTGSRTDFAVDVPVRTHIEVHRTTIPASAAGDAQRQAGLAAEQEKIDSPDFWLSANVQSGPQVPGMRTVRQEAEAWLASLDYDTEVQRFSQEQRARSARASGGPTLGQEASPAERAAYLAANRPFEPPAFTRAGQDWSVRLVAHPRGSGQRGAGQLTIGNRTAGDVHLEIFESLKKSVRGKLRQHDGLTDPLVVVLDLSSPITDDREIAAMLYGRVTTTMLGPSTRWPRPETVGRAFGRTRSSSQPTRLQCSSCAGCGSDRTRQQQNSGFLRDRVTTGAGTVDGTYTRRRRAVGHCRARSYSGQRCAGNDARPAVPVTARAVSALPQRMRLS